MARITDTVTGEVWAFTYDALDRLIGMSGPLNGAWSLDEGGRWLVRTEGGRSWAYDYDDPLPGPHRVYLPLVLIASAPPVRCFAGAWAAAWSGRDAGRSWRLVGVSDGTVLGYDPNGNVLTRTVGGVAWRYAYDAENRLAEVWRGDTLVARYRYDPDGQRVVREVPGARTLVVGDGHEVTPGGVRKVYRLGGELVAVREGSTMRAVVGDPLGSVRVLAQGNDVAAAARYAPYGGIRAESGAWPTDRRYTGQWWEGFGLYDYGAGLYSPSLGRWISADTIVPDLLNPQSLNRYAYVYNRPLRYMDPSGYDPLGPEWESEFKQYHHRDPGLYDRLIRLFSIAFPDEWNWNVFYNPDGTLVDNSVLQGILATAGSHRTWDEMPLALQRLAVWYASSEREAFVRDVGSLFGGLPDRFDEPSMWRAISNPNNPTHHWAALARDGMPEEFSDADWDANVHHWGWAFVVGYYLGPLGPCVNNGREAYMALNGEWSGLPGRMYNFITSSNIRADERLGTRAALMGLDVRVWGIRPSTLDRLWRYNILMQWP